MLRAMHLIVRRDAEPRSSPKPAPTERIAMPVPDTGTTITATTATRPPAHPMRTTMATTPTEAALLQLMWLASPALPIGAFSYSEGLESAVDAGLAATEASAGDWLVDQLHLTPGARRPGGDGAGDRRPGARRMPARIARTQ